MMCGRARAFWKGANKTDGGFQMKKMLTVLALALACLTSLVAADTPDLKTYPLILKSPSKILSNELATGQYKIAVDTASVRVVDERTGKAIEVAAKVETVEKKHEYTSISSERVDGVSQIREIRLGGSKVVISFR
jgi:hypothetical protein